MVQAPTVKRLLGPPSTVTPERYPSRHVVPRSSIGTTPIGSARWSAAPHRRRLLAPAWRNRHDRWERYPSSPDASCDYRCHPRRAGRRRRLPLLAPRMDTSGRKGPRLFSRTQAPPASPGCDSALFRHLVGSTSVADRQSSGSHYPLACLSRIDNDCDVVTTPAAAQRGPGPRELASHLN